MFIEFKKQVTDLLEAELKNRNIEDIRGTFSTPTVESYGELSTNICFQLAPHLKSSPIKIADELAEKLIPTGYIKEIKALKGYLNFYVDIDVFANDLLSKISPDFGAGEKKETITIEHTSANPDGPLHIGHLRNAVIGDGLARLMRFAGYKVEVDYYLNDMGKQAAKVVWGLHKFPLDKSKKEDHGTAEVYVKASKTIEEESLDSEVNNLLSLYESNDKKTVKEFHNAVKYCLKGIEDTLLRLGIKHDKFVWESTFVKNGSVENVIENLSKSKYAKKEESAVFLDLEEFGIEKEMFITRSDGTSLYVARDLAHHAEKLKNTRCINVWGADHKLVSKHLSAALKILGQPAPEFIIHEFISLPDGGMSTRKGVFVSADELVDKTVEMALTEISTRRQSLPETLKQEIAEHVGVSAVRFNISRIAPEKSMVFKWEEALDFERQGAPFIQYAYARGVKILEKGKSASNVWPANFKLNPQEKRLIITISKFPEIIQVAADSRKVSTIANYAIELSNGFHSFYMTSKVIGSPEEAFRTDLVKATIDVLGSVMDLLGIIKLKEM